MKKIIHFFRTSIFLKIIFIFFAGHLAFSLSMYLVRDSFFWEYHFERIQTTTYNYASLIIDKIGTPPNLERAKELSKELQINIRISSDNITWKSSDNIPNPTELDLQKYSKIPDTYVGFDDGLYVSTKRGNTFYLFSIEKGNEDFVYVDQLIFFLHLGIFTIILYIIYILIRRILNPIKVLKEGVHKITAGDFGFQIKSKRKDELGQLVGSFNAMSSEVKEMIQAREQLLLDVSHELRTPLTRIKLALEFLSDSSSKKNIKDDVKDIELMVTEILETERLSSKHGVLKKEVVMLNEVLESISIEYANREPGIELMADNAITIIGDNERLKTLFRNIIDNALKYSEQQKEPVQISLKENSDSVEIVFIDHGEGIPENEIKNIFEPFYRVDKSRSKETGGYGLGMHLAKKIVEAHAGIIKIDSIISKGTTLKVLFPKKLQHL